MMLPVFSALENTTENNLTKNQQIDNYWSDYDDMRLGQYLDAVRIGRDCTFDNFRTEKRNEFFVKRLCLNYVAKILSDVESSHILFLLGASGTGKTHLAKACGVKILSEGKRFKSGFEVPMTGIYYNSHVICKELEIPKLNQNQNGRKSAPVEYLYEKITDRNLIIFDEVYPVRGTVSKDIEAGYLFCLLDRLISKGNSAIVCSNRNYSEMCDFFGDAALSRITPIMNLVKMEGITDKRKEV